MISIGIAGNPLTIERHTSALNKIQDIRISGHLITQPTQHLSTQIHCGNSFSDPESIIDKVDALIITDAGNYGIRMATQALRKAKHVFLYPAGLKSSNDVYQLIKLAREANVILKCGRTGQMGINGLKKRLPTSSAICMVEFQHVLRVSKPATLPDVQKIMLADFEVINQLIQARNTTFKTKGISLFSIAPDIVNTRLEFDNGCVVNYYCNTAGIQHEHNATLVLKDSVIKYNLLANELSGWYLNNSGNQDENPIFIDKFVLEQSDHLLDDLHGFIRLINSGPAFLSIYDNGFESFVLTDRILEKITKTFVQFA